MQRCMQPSGTNSPKACVPRTPARRLWRPGAHASPSRSYGGMMLFCSDVFPLFSGMPRHTPPRPSGRGGTDTGRLQRRGPPLPIPNREVKPACADGTAIRGRVGRRPTYTAPRPDGRGAFYLGQDLKTGGLGLCEYFITGI